LLCNPSQKYSFSVIVLVMTRRGILSFLRPFR
jgi:hypothetical protein